MKVYIFVAVLFHNIQSSWRMSFKINSVNSIHEKLTFSRMKTYKKVCNTIKKWLVNIFSDKRREFQDDLTKGLQYFDKLKIKPFERWLRSAKC